MTGARRITPADVTPPSQYAAVRAERRRAMAAFKRNRRLEVGPFVTFYFECFETMLHQVNEMLYIEKGGAAQIADELARTEAALAPWCSQNPRPFFRPPNGGVDADVLAAVGAAGYSRTVTWDVDTIDWRPIVNDPPGPTADQIVAKVLAKAQNGSIVLMHLGGYETFEALPRVVEGLRDRGFDLVTLDELG